MSDGSPRYMDQLPNELLSRILVAAASVDGHVKVHSVQARILSNVCKRWRGLCFGAPEMWGSVAFSAPLIPARRQGWLDGKLWLLQRVGPMVHGMLITDDGAGQSLMQPLLQAAPRTLRLLHLRTRWGAHSADLPQLLALVHMRFTSLSHLELSSLDQWGGLYAAQQQPAAAGVQLDARLVAGILPLAGTLTELKLSMHAVKLPPLGPLTALRRLRQLVVHGHSSQPRPQVPAPAQFPCLEEFDLRLGAMEVSGIRLSTATWSAAPLRTLKLWSVDAPALPALLEALRPPAAGPLERLFVSELVLGADAAAGAAAVEACTPHWQQLRELDVVESATIGPALGSLLRQLPRLETLRLANCGLRALPAGQYISGLRTLSLPENDLQALPPLLLQATRLQQLDLQGNLNMFASEVDLRQLLAALPELQQLDLTETGLTQETAEAVKTVAAARSLSVQLPEREELYDPWLNEDGGYYSSTSDSSDDGCPRYSWAGCAYASRW